MRGMLSRPAMMLRQMRNFASMATHAAPSRPASAIPPTRGPHHPSRQVIPGPAAFFHYTGRGLGEKLANVVKSWDDIFTVTKETLKEAGISVRDRRYFFRQRGVYMTGARMKPIELVSRTKHKPEPSPEIAARRAKRSAEREVYERTRQRNGRVIAKLTRRVVRQNKKMTQARGQVAQAQKELSRLQAAGAPETELAPVQASLELNKRRVEMHTQSIHKFQHRRGFVEHANRHVNIGRPRKSVVVAPR